MDKDAKMKDPCGYYSSVLLELAKAMAAPRLIPADLYFEIYEIYRGFRLSPEYLEELFQKVWKLFEAYQTQQREKLFGFSQIDEIEARLKDIFSALTWLSEHQLEMPMPY